MEDDDKRREADITHRPRTSPGTSSRRPFFSLLFVANSRLKKAPILLGQIHKLDHGKTTRA
jgi:hypothetical protein